MSSSPFRQDLLRGEVVFITGGGSGIGFGIAMALGSHGAKVAIMGRREEVLQEATDKLTNAGIEALAVPGDVRNFDKVEESISKVVSKFGKLSILVNCAAGNFLCPTELLSPGGFKSVIDIDLLGTFNVSKAAYEHLVAAKPAVILNISATLHYQGTLMQPHVMAAKAGIDALARNLACEWGPKGIRVVGIAPGPIGDTEGMRRLAPLGAAQRIEAEVPLGRLGRVEDIANAAVFLCSSAASYVNGETLVVDGGQWLAKPPFISREAFDKMATAGAPKV